LVTAVPPGVFRYVLVPYGQYCAARGAGQDGQLLTPDGSEVLVTRVVAVGQDYADSVVEYSARTGQRLTDVVQTIRTPYAGPPVMDWPGGVRPG
jgi:hypothetical protein